MVLFLLNSVTQAISYLKKTPKKKKKHLLPEYVCNNV